MMLFCQFTGAINSFASPKH